LQYSLLPTTAGYGLILGPYDGKVAVIGNLFAHNKERNPLSRATHAVIVNNVVYNRANMDVDLQSEKGLTTHTAVIGNVYLRGPDYARSDMLVMVRTSGNLALTSQSKGYVADNFFQDRSGEDEWSVVSASSG